MQNILRHGFECGQIQGHVMVLFQAVPDRLNITFIDDAPPSFPHLWPVGGKPAEQGGLGLEAYFCPDNNSIFSANQKWQYCKIGLYNRSGE